MIFLFALSALLAAQLSAQATDETAIRSIIQDETDAWNQGDAAAYSRHFAARGTFTNIRGQFFTGHAAFLKQHDVIFQGMFKNTTVQQDIVSLEFVDPDVAVVETLTSVSGVSQTAPGTSPDAKVRHIGQHQHGPMPTRCRAELERVFSTHQCGYARTRCLAADTLG